MTEAHTLAPSSRDARFSRGRLSRPLLGRLPLARLLPQDGHSLIDYLGSLFVGCLALFTTDPVAQYATIGAMIFGAGVSLVTDYRISLAKLVPIELHECLDYLLGGFMVVAPFLFAFWPDAPIVSVLLIASGVTLIGMAMVTDYRAYTRA